MSKQRNQWELEREAKDVQRVAAFEVGRKITLHANAVSAASVFAFRDETRFNNPRDIETASLYRLLGRLTHEARRREAERLATIRGDNDVAEFFR